MFIYVSTYKHDNSPIEGKNWQVPPLRQYVSTGHLWIDKIPFESMAVNRKMLKIILNFKYYMTINFNPEFST